MRWTERPATLRSCSTSSTKGSRGRAPRPPRDEHDRQRLLSLCEVPADGVDHVRDQQEQRAAQLTGADAPAVEGDEPAA